MRSSRFALTAAITAAVVLVPVAALAQTAAVPVDVASTMALIAAGWFFLDKLIEFTPLKDNSIVAAIRSLLNQMLGKKPQ